MKISIKNLGAIKQAEFTLGELTIICGENNTGKTYVTHATYGFMDFLRTDAEFPVHKSDIEKLYSEGAIQLSLQPYIEDLKNHLDVSTKKYSEILHRIFAGSEQHFDDAALTFEMDYGSSRMNDKIELTFGTANRGILNVKSISGSNVLEIRLIVERSDEELPPKYVVEDMIRNGIGTVLMGGIIPRPFLASAERTGAAIFQKELDFTRNRLVEILGDKRSKLHPVQLLGKFSSEYPFAVRKNVDFIRELPNIKNKESFILKNHHDLLDAFRDIIGGEYKVSKDGEIEFHPSSNKRIKLSLVESSSAVRSLLDIGFYLRHVAAPGDLLMVDEPELNLHPENQRKVARLFARLVNIGIKVFITTHSDYIIKELNTLIMLHQGGERLKKLAGRERYNDSEVLDPRRVKVYIAEEALIKLDSAKKKGRYPTLVAAEIDSRLGIDARSFDKTIEDMNRIQDEIVWGGDA
jgi:predicted ATPase